MLSPRGAIRGPDTDRLGDVGDPVDRLALPLSPRVLAALGGLSRGIAHQVHRLPIELWDIRLDDYPRWGGTHPGARHRGRRPRPALRADAGPAPGAPALRLAGRGRRAGFPGPRGSSILGPTDALDEIVYAKVLPKLRGDDSPRFQQALDDCRRVLSATAAGAPRTRCRTCSTTWSRPAAPASGDDHPAPRDLLVPRAGPGRRPRRPPADRQREPWLRRANTGLVPQARSRRLAAADRRRATAPGRLPIRPRDRSGLAMDTGLLCRRGHRRAAGPGRAGRPALPAQRRPRSRQARP